MSKKTFPVNRKDLYQIENYLYNLILLSESPEFVLEEDINKVRKILREIDYMRMTLNILLHVFKNDPGERPVVAWDLDNPNKKCDYQTYWFFSSIKAAAIILKGEHRHIKSLCDGKRKMPACRQALEQPVKVKGGNIKHTTTGWLFRYKDKWDDNPDNTYRVFDPQSPLFEIKNIKYI
jgi:hypothetical protein